MLRFTCIIAVIATSSCLYAEDEWPQFRGPGGQGHSHATDLPLTWSESENISWKTPLPGEGHSSPVITDNQIWLTAARSEELTAEEEKARLSKLANPRGLKLAGTLSLDALMIDRVTGAIKQQITLFEVPNPEPKHSLNSYASPTPVTSGDFVYCHFGTYGTACIDRHTGNVVWKNDSIHVDHQNGPGSSPVLWNDLLIIHFDGIDSQFLAALDTKAGTVRWKTMRSGEMDPKAEFQKAYGTPLIVDTDSHPVMISPAANWVYGYDPATGRELWKAHYGKLGFSTVPRPVTSSGRTFIATSYMQSRLLAVRYDGSGDVTESHVEWTLDRQAPKKPSLLAVEDRLYTVTDNGIAACLDTADGSEIWKQRLGGDFSASPLYADGTLYFFGQNGQTTVLQEGRQGEQVARNELAAGLMASPAVAGNALFLRTTEALYRIEAAR